MKRVITATAKVNNAPFQRVELHFFEKPASFVDQLYRGWLDFDNKDKQLSGFHNKRVKLTIETIEE
ncbi:MAG: hypothetical protein LIP02_10760 [Bacteroidales bacterium]|nr:hypothetical protein [Bacteroidales bacterium]MCC8051554.1 hypothetical protein [Clostridiales bacterium]